MKIAHTWHAVLLYPKTSGVQYFYAHHTVRFLSSSRHMRAVAHPLTHPSSNMNTTHHPNNMVPCYTSDKSSLSTLAQGFYILSGQYQNMSAVQELHVCVCVCVYVWRKASTVFWNVFKFGMNMWVEFQWNPIPNMSSQVMISWGQQIPCFSGCLLEPTWLESTNRS